MPNSTASYPPLWSGPTLPLATELPSVPRTQFHVIRPFRGAEDEYRFVHGVALEWYRDKLYASLGMNRHAENTAGEESNCLLSKNAGQTWGMPQTIGAGCRTAGTAISHGVFLSHQGTLWAFHGAYRGTLEDVHTLAFSLSEDGTWLTHGRVLQNGFWPMQRPAKMDNGNWIMAGLTALGDCSAGGTHPPAVAISDGDDLLQWTLHTIACQAPPPVWGESCVLCQGSTVLNIARYGHESRALVAYSADYGENWTPAVPSNLPMATSKPYAGTLSDGRHYLLGTIHGGPFTTRAPLTIATTRPGELSFSGLQVIRPALFTEGPGESHPQANLAYPYAVEKEGLLWIAYSNDGGNQGRSAEGRGAWNNNSVELALVDLAKLG